MKIQVSIVLLVIAAASALPRPEEEKYHVKIFNDYESLPLSEIEGLIDCITYGKNCNPMRDAYRAAYPAVFISACELCTTEQKKAGYAFFKRATKDLPGKLDEFKNKFDPEGKYYEPYFNALKASA